MKMAENSIVLKVCLDVFILICVTFPLLAITLWVSPYERGYFEDDQSLKFSYKQQTITELVLAVSGFAIAIVTIIAVEVIRDVNARGIGMQYIGKSKISGWLWESYSGIGAFAFGAACQQLTSNFAKYVIGRLRPHFFDVCQPIPMVSPLNDLGYIQRYLCRGTDENLIKDMRLSFPSAHSSFAMYCAVYLICYLQIKANWRGSKLFRHILQYALFMGAWFVGLSRVQDHMHHWSDVAAGFAVGVTYGFLVFFFVLSPKKLKKNLDDIHWDQPPPLAAEVIPRPVLR